MSSQNKMKSDDYHKRQTINFWYAIYDVDLECEICREVLHSWHCTENYGLINNTTKTALN